MLLFNTTLPGALGEHQMPSLRQGLLPPVQTVCFLYTHMLTDVMGSAHISHPCPELLGIF